MDNNKEKNMILHDNLWKVCIQLSIPAVIAMILYGLNGVFDAIFVGRYVGETAFAGVSIVYPLTQIPLGLGSLVGVGAGSYLSILIGENNKELQKKLVGNSNTIIVIFTVITMMLGFLFMKPLLYMMGANSETYGYASEYFRVSLLGSIVWIAGLGYNMIVRAEGKMKMAAMIMGVGLVVNIIANYILMGVFHFGVAGAAWGTNLGMFIYVILFFLYCKKGRASFETNAFRFFYDKEVTKEIISLGMPSFIMSVMMVIQGVIIMNALSTYGSDADIAFYGIAFRLFNLYGTPVFGLMRALQPVVGVNYGAKQYDRVIKSYVIFSFVALLLVFPVWGVSMLFPNQVLQSMLPSSVFAAKDILYFRMFISLTPALCIILTAMTFWPAIKQAKPAMLIGIGRQVLLYIPLMILLPKFFGIGGIYFGSFGIDFGLTILIIIMLKKEFVRLRKEEYK